jgi:hypothetical protein
MPTQKAAESSLPATVSFLVVVLVWFLTFAYGVAQPYSNQVRGGEVLLVGFASVWVGIPVLLRVFKEETVVVR